MKRIRTNRRRRMKLKNFIACVTALSVLMGSTYFAMAEDTYICGKEEHTHTADCMECSLEEIHDLTAAVICGSEEHEHVDTCYEVENELTCGKDEVAAEEVHAHDDSCYTEVSVIVCGEEETEGHQHTDGCYTEGELTCGEEETEGHQHDASCEGTETELTCGLDEKEEHAHDAACYTEVKEKICGSEEHKHEDACYPLAEGSHEHGTDCVMEVACGEEEHKHEDACVKQEVQEEPVTDENSGGGSGSGGGGGSDDEEADIPAAVQDVIDAAAALPTYDELEVNADDDAYMTAFFAQAQPIVQAYLALTDEEKAQVPADIVGLLAIVPVAMPADEPTDEDKVAEAERLMLAMPTLDELQEKMESYSTQKAFAQYFAENVTAARDAYNALSDDDKEKVSADAKAKLDALQYIPGTRSKDSSREFVEKPIDGDPHIFKFSESAKFYQNTPHDDLVTFMLINASEQGYGDKYWSPEGGLYEPGPHNNNIPGGNNNFVVTYCCDNDTGAEYGAYYKRFNLEDAGYYNAEEARHIRAIVKNAYPFVTGDTMRAMLDGKLKYDDGTVIDVKDIEDAELMAATQNAIWTIANGDTNNYSMSYPQGKWYYPLVSEYDNYYVDHEKIGQRIDAIKDYLVAMKEEPPAANEIVISDVQAKAIAPVTGITGEDGLYRVMVKVALNNSGSGKQDKITIRAESQTTGSTDQTSVEYKTTEYVLYVNAKPGETINVIVEGTQVLPTGVYFYAALDKDGKPEIGEPESNPGRRESQNFVGVATGTTPVSAKLAITLADRDTTEKTATLNLKKVDAEGTALAGAEFTLAYVDAEGKATDIEPVYTSDENGNVTIEGLLIGNKYQLRETKAPEGYIPSDAVIEFTVEADTDGKAVIEYVTQNVVLVDNAIQFVNTKGGGGNGGGGGGSDDISVKVEKVWNVPEGTDIPDSIKVDLFRDGDYYDTKTLRAKNNWKATWELDEDFEWTVKEKDVPEGYKVTIDGDMEDGETVTITNTKTSIDPEGGKKTVNVSKVWIGDTEETRPDSIKVQLYKNGIAYGDVVTLNSENWSVAWSDLDKADADGNEIQWTVKEIDVPAGYTASVVETADGTFTLTNTKGTTPNKPTEPDSPGRSDSDDDGDVLGIDDENVPKGDMVLADEEEVLAAETGDSNHIVAAVVAMAAALAGLFMLRKKKVD